MAERAIQIPVEAGVVLEARHSPGRGSDVGLILHPHPLYGGSMDNNVVLAAREALGSLGLATVRLNLRGVGRSTGESCADPSCEGEVRDVAAALGHAGTLVPCALPSVHLVAYSFGAWIALRAIDPCPAMLSTLVLIAPPVDFLSFAGLRLPDRPCVILVGERDGYGRPTSVAAWLESAAPPQKAPRVSLIERADHFFHGKEDLLVERIAELLGPSIESPESC